MSTKAFAEKAGVPYTTLRSMLERGFAKSAVENVIRVCRALDITVEDMERLAAENGENKSATQTIAAHHDVEEWTEEELEEIEQFKEFVRMKRKKGWSIVSDKKLDLILEKLEAIETQQLSQGEHMGQLIQIVGTANMKLQELSEEVHQIKDDVGMLKSIQQEQQKILDRLAVRSISQEADIAELRRIK